MKDDLQHKQMTKCW